MLESDVERAACDLLASMGWEVAHVQQEALGEAGTLGRETRGDAVLVRRLRAALEKLNRDLPADAIDEALLELTRDRSAMGLVQANREAYRLLTQGVKVKLGGHDDEERVVTVRVVDWNEPANNDFFVAQQLWVQGEIYLRRADLVGFVNGLPLVFIELKGIHKNVEAAFRENLRDYLDTIPQLFWWNAVVVLSNGLESRVGSLTAAWEHFKEWKRVEREDEPARVSLEVLLRGVCDRARLLDLVESFTLFSEKKSAVTKVLGQNHQFLGVNNAIDAVRRYQLASTPPGVAKDKLAERRRLGVFWHTQGSGKSFSMVFFSQKILRKLPGNWTFVVVTDREDLDDQIYKTFVACGAVSDKNVQAKTADHLKRLLTEDHRYVFTLIQKFRTPVKGASYPKLSDRSDIIVIADEAHRSQYDTFALNLRNALPNAAFIGFTGTPLVAGEEKTREVFGDYVSIYNFRQAIEDSATVPLYYEARIPELQLTNEDLADELAELLEEADLDEEHQKKVERRLSQPYRLITRDDRLDRIADDLVAHFIGLNVEAAADGRPWATKAMVVAIDKTTAVAMHDKVRAAWAKRLDAARAERRRYENAKRADLEALVRFLEETDMAVVISSSQNEAEAFQKKGLVIAPHRKRMNEEDLDTKFKDERDPLRIVFVCAMWMTGFDVPSCGVVYLDKPMRNHTLMQTIARANRVFEGKVNGLVVDYIGVFRNLQRALAIYGAGAGGGVRDGDTPVQPKEVQVGDLAALVGEAKAFCEQHGVDLARARTENVLVRLAALRDAMAVLVHPPDRKKRFLELADAVNRVYRALGLDPRKQPYSPDWGVLADLAGGLRGAEAPVDIGAVMEAIDDLLDRSIAAGAPMPILERRSAWKAGRFRLGSVDFEKLAQFFSRSKHKPVAAEVMASAVRSRVDALVRQNPTRKDLRERLEQLLAEYNEGAQSAHEHLDRLVAFAKKLEEEEQRAGTEGLDQERLAFHDLLLAPGLELSAKDRETLKSIARGLPAALGKKLVIDWRKTQRARAAVKAAIRDALDALPEAYGPEDFDRLVEAVYEHVFESYWGEGKSKYGDS